MIQMSRLRRFWNAATTGYSAMGYAIQVTVTGLTTTFYVYAQTFHPPGNMFLGALMGLSAFGLLILMVIGGAGLFRAPSRRSNAFYVIVIGGVLYAILLDLITIPDRSGFLQLFGNILAAALVALVLDRRASTHENANPPNLARAGRSPRGSAR